MLKIPTSALLIALIVAGAIVNGAATQRWTAFEPDPALTERLNALELRYDDWQATVVPTEMPTNERSFATSRRYLSASTGRSGVVTLISGVPGSVSTHTPDICYPGSGYRILRATRREKLDLPGGREANFYVGDFEKKTETRFERIRVRWAWTTDGIWVAPDNPRWQLAASLARVPVLYKLYIATPLGEEDRGEDDPATAGFVIASLAQFTAGFDR